MVIDTIGMNISTDVQHVVMITECMVERVVHLLPRLQTKFN